jgi:hypothetical protein
LDSQFKQPIERAVVLGAGLKEIGRAAEDIAIQYATAVEDGSLNGLRAALALRIGRSSSGAPTARRSELRGRGRACPGHLDSACSAL